MRPDGHLRYSVMVDGSWVHRAIDREGVPRTQCQEFIATAWASARLDRLSLPPRGASAVENGARFSPNIAADVPVSRRLPETLRISRLLDPRLALLDAIERIRVKVAAFHGAH